MNYGWDNAYTTWYTLDALHLGDYDEEYMMVNIFPVTSLRHAITGIYPREDFNFRYFNQDASGSSAVFEPDQLLQFLPNIVVTSTGSIKFGASSWFFTRGDASRGIRTDSGGIRLYSGGQMKLY
jgi:hypothetical protein